MYWSEVRYQSDKWRSSDVKKVDLRQKVLTENERIALGNRERFAETGTLVLNFVSSPGSGKTTLIEETVKALKDECRMFVVPRRYWAFGQKHRSKKGWRTR